MDRVYSLTLLVALVAGLVSALVGVLNLRWSSSLLRWIARSSGLLAVCAGAISFSVHLIFGHGPAAEEPMAFGRFLLSHPVYGVVTMLLLGTFVVLRQSRRRT